MKLFLLLSMLTVTLHIKETYINPKGMPAIGMTACTGVFVSPNTILTAGHCVETSIGQQWARLNNGKVFTADVLAVDKKEDLALLYVHGPKHPYVRLGKPVHQADKVYTVNSGQDNQDTYGEGVVENIITLDELASPGIMHSIAIFQGASGSGLFNGKGQLVGINVLKQGAIGWAVNTSTIEKFLRGYKVN
jgi:serine protease Do